MPRATVAAEAHAKPSRRPPCGPPVCPAAGCFRYRHARSTNPRKSPESGRVRPQRRAAENGRRAPGAWPRPWIPSRIPPHAHCCCCSCPKPSTHAATAPARGGALTARRSRRRERAARDSAVSSARSSAGMSRISALSLACVCVAACVPSRDARRARAPRACAPRRPERARAPAAPPRPRGAARGAGAHPPSSKIGREFG